MRHILPVVGVAAGTAAVLFCAMLMLMTSILALNGQLDVSGPSPTASQVSADAKRIGGARSFRAAPDGSTSAMDAGDALLSVAATWRRRAPSPIERRASVDYPRWEPLIPPASLFPRPREMQWTAAAILAAGTGLTPEQRTTVERAAAHPARAEFSRAARAQAADVYGALLKLPLAERLDAWTYPHVSLLGASAAAESHAALVALDVADRRPLDAERHAREILAVGALMLDLHSMANNRTAIDVLDRGVGALKAVYIATGRERDARELLDSVVTAPLGQWRPRPRSGAAALTQMLRDASLPRGVRVHAFAALSSRVCASPRQLLFGIDDTYRGLATYARDSIARFSSEKLYVDAIASMLTGRTGTTPNPDGAFLTTIARMIDGVVGGRRFETCARVPGASSWLE